MLAWRKISPGMSKLFPNVEACVQCGLMTEYELQLYNAVQVSGFEFGVKTQIINSCDYCL